MAVQNGFFVNKLQKTVRRWGLWCPCLGRDTREASVVVRGRMGATHPDLRDPLTKPGGHRGWSDAGASRVMRPRHRVGIALTKARQITHRNVKCKGYTQDKGSHTRYKRSIVRQRSRSLLFARPYPQVHPRLNLPQSCNACVHLPTRCPSSV